MYGNDELMSWYRTVFALSQRIQPSEIDEMPYVEFKIFVTLYNNWIEEIKRAREQRQH